MILKSISTHFAKKENGKISIYLKGMDKTKFDADDLKEYPHWFKDEKLYSIALECEDDLFAIFENLEENNRVNYAELAACF